MKVMTPLHFLGCSFILNIRHSMIFFELYLLLVLYSGFRAMGLQFQSYSIQIVTEALS